MPGTVNGVYVRVDMKTNDPKANLVANVGADWWLDASAGYVLGFNNNPGAGMSDWVRLTTNWRTLYFTSFGPQQFQADPPPGLASTASGSGSGSIVTPTVAITSTGGTVTSATQTITGTVDVADAGSTVTILDGATKVGTATVSSAGSWSTAVNLANAGANVLTATDANAAGTGTSNAVTYTLQSPTAPTPTPPTLTIANHTLTVTARGGSVRMGISETAPSSATNVTLKITGLPKYEVISDGLGHSFSGSSITMTKAEVDSGLKLTSYYHGNQHPVATLQVSASDTAGTSAPQTIRVDDPPPATHPVAWPFSHWNASLQAQGLGEQLLHARESSGTSIAHNQWDDLTQLTASLSLAGSPLHHWV
jgi:hypothetical protein